MRKRIKLSWICTVTIMALLCHLLHSSLFLLMNHDNVKGRFLDQKDVNVLISSTESFGDKILTYLYPAHSQFQVCHGWIIPHSFILSFLPCKLCINIKNPSCVMALVCSRVQQWICSTQDERCKFPNQNRMMKEKKTFIYLHFSKASEKPLSTFVNAGL